MRHGALTLARQVNQQHGDGRMWDLVFCSDMLDLAAWRGLVHPEVAALPAVIYFHENQLTYPLPAGETRDYHYGYTNITSAFAADAVWYNSAYHRDDFLTAADDFLRRMPDFSEEDIVAHVRQKSAVMYPGITPIGSAGEGRSAGPLHVVMAARWEADKAPEAFMRVIDALAESGSPFVFSMLGGDAGDETTLVAFRQRHAARCRHWGHLPRATYRQALQDADVIVSTADHEFFGLSIVEAVSAGCLPLVPRRLAYPEVLDPSGTRNGFFFDDEAQLAARLKRLCDSVREAPHETVWPVGLCSPQTCVEPFTWSRRQPEMDSALIAVAGVTQPADIPR